MTDTPMGPDDPGNETPDEATNDEISTGNLTQRTDQIDLQVEVQRSYLDYAMSVIVSRALPDVKDGLKPVHRRVIYAMYDGGYRPDRGWNKCSRVVGEVMGLYHPHGDSAIYDTLVRLAQHWAMRAPLVSGQGNFGSPGNDKAAAMRYTECKMAPLAMEMVRDIDEDTVDFKPNYDNKDTEPVVLPARFPNLLVNGSTGIAVGMATNIPTHNLREVAEAVQWSLDHPDAEPEELLEAAMERVKGPDFPGGATIVGRSGIEQAYRTGRGSVIMRAVMDIEEDSKGRQQIVATELPYMTNPDNLMLKIAELVNSGKLTGLADIRDDTSARTGTRLVFVLKRDAQPRVVMNNLYKHTALQDTFGCNMLALVDDVPRVLRLDQFISLWVAHQIDVIQRRTRYRLRKAEEQAHVYRGLVKALDALDEVIALIRRSPNTDEARTGLMALLEIDEIQATAILDMQLRRLAALERQKIVDTLAEIEERIADFRAILASEERQREIVGNELREIVDKYGDERRTKIIAASGDMSEEDFIPDSDVIVTITHGGYAKRTATDAYRVQKRGGKGVRGATLKADDEVAHLFATSNHQWVLFFTNLGRVYRAKVWQLPEASRDARGGHVAGLLSFLPNEHITQVLTLRGYDDAQYLLLATRNGLVKKTPLEAYDSPRQAGLIALNFRDEGDELIGAGLVSDDDDVLLISKKGQAIRFAAAADQLRPMGRVTSGVTGMKFRDGDELLSMSVIDADTPEDDRFVFTVTDSGYAKRTPVSAYRQQGRGGLGIKAMKLNENRGELVGGLVVRDADEVMAIKNSGQITRSAVAEVPVKGRDTMGVKFVGVRGDDRVARIAVNPEQTAEAQEAGVADTPAADGSDEGVAGDNAGQTAGESTESGAVTHDGGSGTGSVASDSPDDTAAAEETEQ
ncbi:DNA gyrase subunit A [Naumannella cuiyingiana]|uniref:DNA gyrase subunit A n=1 Tax=Naumannella cuiyingiana TaxID=1347891 RepID=A0A7Z0D8V2_9ACTN|nr:DNA gyrase subunit A [Naumannella cuiyingiana]NYI71080.1 DNA gyrase subunit A [Naumannella cuiyingiana]